MALIKLNLAQGVTGTLPTSNYVSGITEADQWRITSDQSVTGGVFLTSNYERDDTNFTKIGTGLTESSGVFTFGSTGMYLIKMNFLYQASGNDATYAGGEIFTTTDDSSYSQDSEAYQFIYNGMSGDTEHSTTNVSTIFDVTNTTTHKFKIRATTSHACNLKGDTTINKTYFTCIRLGDT